MKLNKQQLEERWTQWYMDTINGAMTSVRQRAIEAEKARYEFIHNNLTLDNETNTISTRHDRIN